MSEELKLTDELKKTTCKLLEGLMTLTVHDFIDQAEKENWSLALSDVRALNTMFTLSKNLNCEMDPEKVEYLYPKEACHPKSFRIRYTDDRKHMLIFCCPKEHWDEEKKVCKTSIKLHSIHHMGEKILGMEE